MTIRESLRQINLFPIPDATIEDVCEKRGLTPDATTDAATRATASFRLATADIYKWLAFCPSSVSENGISFSISESDRRRFLDEANKIYGELEPDEIYGLSTITDRSYMW